MNKQIACSASAMRLESSGVVLWSWCPAGNHTNLLYRQLYSAMKTP